VNRDSGTEAANPGWLERLVRPQSVHSSKNLLPKNLPEIISEVSRQSTPKNRLLLALSALEKLPKSLAAKKRKKLKTRSGLTSKLRHSRRARLESETMIPKFHNSLNCHMRRLLPAASC